jgi:hypothetical protein
MKYEIEYNVINNNNHIFKSRENEYGYRSEIVNNEIQIS